MQSIVLCLIKLLVWGANKIPTQRAVSLIAALLRGFLCLAPKHRRVALRNLELAFPEKGPEWRQEIVNKSLTSFARVLVDSLRLEHIDAEWVRNHVQVPILIRYGQMKRSAPGKGIVLATGHLGSFDLMGRCLPFLGQDIAFIVRNFKLKAVDDWFNGIRESNGNRAIPRKGAFKGVMKALKEGRDTAILFDQNVRKEHAVFVDWFGISAATTALPAIAALRNEAAVIVASMQYLGDDNYRLNAKEMDFSEIYANDKLSAEDKILEITRQISCEYEKMIRACPEEWFWMHRRWRTRPEGDGRDYYQGC